MGFGGSISISSDVAASGGSPHPTPTDAHSETRTQIARVLTARLGGCSLHTRPRDGGDLLRDEERPAPRGQTTSRSCDRNVLSRRSRPRGRETVMADEHLPIRTESSFQEGCYT